MHKFRKIVNDKNEEVIEEVVDGISKPSSIRDKLKLTYNEYQSACYLNSEISFLNLSFKDEDIDETMQIIRKISNKYFPDRPILELSKKDQFKDTNVGRSFVLKISDKRPELYFIIENGNFMLADQFRYSMYDNESPWKKLDTI